MLLDLKKLLAFFFILLALGIIGWFVVLEYSVKWIQKELDTAIVQLRKKGFTVTYSKVDIDGTPFSIQVTLDDPRIKDPQGMFQWEGKTVEITTRPWDFTTFDCRFPGDQKVSVPQNLPFTIGTLHFKDAEGNLRLSTHGDIKDLSLAASEIIPMVGDQTQILSLQNFSLKLKDMLQPLASQFSVSVDLIGIDKLLKVSPRPYPVTFQMDAHFSGYKDPKIFPKTLAEWRDGGGVLDITKLNFSWDPIIAQAKGTLTLDEDMYPLGSFSSHISGHQKALDFLVETGVVKKKKAALASFALNLLSAPDEIGGKLLTVPITLQNKVLSVGPAPLLKLQPVSPVL